MTEDEQQAIAEVADLMSELSARMVVLEIEQAALEDVAHRAHARIVALESMVLKLSGEVMSGVSDDENCSAPGLNENDRT